MKAFATIVEADLGGCEFAEMAMVVAAVAVKEVVAVAATRMNVVFATEANGVDFAPITKVTKLKQREKEKRKTIRNQVLPWLPYFFTT